MRFKNWIAIGFLYVIIMACTKKSEPDPPVIYPPVTSRSYLALGDSYTIGQSVPASDRFPSQVRAMLNNLGKNVEEPKVIATTGWTTTDLKEAIKSQNVSGPYDLVTLLIGVNDQYQFRDTMGYRARFADLLNTSIRLSGNRRERVIVVSIPDYSVTPFAQFSDTAMTRRQIGWFNNINREVSEQNLCKFVDITPGSREALTNPALIANDGLHPSGLEYKKWAEKIVPLAKDFM